MDKDLSDLGRRWDRPSAGTGRLGLLEPCEEQIGDDWEEEGCDDDSSLAGG